MKVLVATSLHQGWRRNDFHHAVDGEFVRLAMTCDGAKVDDACGCARSFAGLITLKATTTARVTSVEMTREGYAEYLSESNRRSGFPDDPEEADELIRLAAAFPEGAILERRGSRIRERGGR